MAIKIHRQTVSELLWESLLRLMNLEELQEFRLVGGTSLSLLMGHRISVDIDLFTDTKYGSIDFKTIYRRLKKEFAFVSQENWMNDSMGNSCFIGHNQNDLVKLDLFYTDDFVFPIKLNEKIRLSSLEEIAAMKLDVIGRGGRKKDFWDIHALMDFFTLDEMLNFYLKRYPYNFSKEELISQLTNFETAENDPEPNCLQSKYWELIKLDIEESIVR
jgi:hypothetical protein